MLLNAFNATDTAKGAGILVNCMATSGNMAGSCIASDFNSNDGFTGITNVGGGGIEAGAIIMVVVRKNEENNSPIVESNMNGIWMAGSDAVNGSSLSVKAGTNENAKFVKAVPTEPDLLPVGAKFHITRVMVHHLKFDMGGSSVSNSGSVFYGHGSHDDHFGGTYGYRDMMMRDIHSTVVAIKDGDGTELTAAITKTSVNVQLPTGVEGATYRVINTNAYNNAQNTGAITVSPFDNQGDPFTLNAGGHSRYTYITDIDGSNGKWYEQF